MALKKTCKAMHPTEDVRCWSRDPDPETHRHFYAKLVDGSLKYIFWANHASR